MFHVPCLALLIAVMAGGAQPAIPDTPAGRTLKAWLEAFNSGDRGQMGAYYRTYEPDKSADNVMPFRDATGGFELLEIMRSEPLGVEFLVKERRGETRAIGKLEVKHAEPAKVTSSCYVRFRREHRRRISISSLMLLLALVY
jgi:hypothetical protein